MCDGNYAYPVKGGRAMAVRAYLIMTGNKHPECLYPNAWKLVSARFHVIELKGFNFSGETEELVDELLPTLITPGGFGYSNSGALEHSRTWIDGVLKE